MKKSTPVSELLVTNCTIVESSADVETIRMVFDFFPNSHLPVVDGIRFVGVILRDEFFQKFLVSTDQPLLARDLVSKEIVSLSVDDPVSEAKEIFDTKTFDIIPVVDSDGDLAGILLREEFEVAFMEMEQGVGALRWKFSALFSF